MPTRLDPPANLVALQTRASMLAGRLVRDVERELGFVQSGPMRHRKGKTGELVERALGAQGGALRGPDFPELGVELKTIPLDGRGRPRESTFVCALNLRAPTELSWESSLVRSKLLCVLWLPVLGDGVERRFGKALLFRPTLEQEAVLRADFDDLVGMIAIGKIESLTARAGRWLQVRPKAATGAVRTRVVDDAGESVWTVPRGFYLRARFTHALLRDPATLAGSY